MKKDKIGTVFFVVILAFAGIGISYAGWTDVISITGTVDTGDVSWEVIEYSGTWVWKDIPNHGKIVNYGVPIDYDDDGHFDDDPDSEDYDSDQYTLVASSWAQEGNEVYDVEVFYDNLFPCVNFEADVTIKYTGSIPGRLNELILSKDQGWDDYIDDYTTVEVFDASGYSIPVEQLPGYQLHEDDTVHVVVTIHLPQDNSLMLKSGSFNLEVIVVQWNEYPYDYSGECGGDVDLGIVKKVSYECPRIANPYIGTNIQYGIIVNNYGPDTATNVEVYDMLPPELTFVSCNPFGAYDPGTGIWDVGTLLSGESAFLEITATIESYGTSNTKTQLCMILDGSGSIGSGDWTIMLDGIAAALRDPAIFPYDSSVELTVIQFSGDYSDGDKMAWVEVGPVVITDIPSDPGYYDDIATDIQAIVQDDDRTPTYAGIELAQTTLEESGNHPDNGGDFSRQVFNLVTDGAPNEYPPGYSSGKEAAEAYRDVLVASLNSGEDEFDAEGVGISLSNIDWLKNEIVWPEPGYEAPPFDQGAGWVRSVADYTEFANTIGEKFQVILQSIVNCAEVTSDEDDLNPTDNIACVTIYPVNPPQPNTVESSTMIFEGTLDQVVTGVYTGTIDAVAGYFYIPGGPGTHYDSTDDRYETPDDREAVGGFDVYAKEGGTAYYDDTVQGTIGSDHDAYSNAGGWGAFWDPDVPDWEHYQLTLTTDHWYLEYKGPALGTPMSGAMGWVDMYASEDDIGMYRGTVPSDPDANDGDAALNGGGPQAWDMDWTWGSEAIPLQYPGFEVTMESLGGDNWRVILTPAPI